jgi:hypothetical protein
MNALRWMGRNFDLLFAATFSIGLFLFVGAVLAAYLRGR